jgi:hypothetical protein
VKRLFIELCYDKCTSVVASSFEAGLAVARDSAFLTSHLDTPATAATLFYLLAEHAPEKNQNPIK